LRSSPTELILDLWEARECQSQTALTQLLQVVRAMGRHDAAALLDTYAAHNHVSL